MIDVVMTVVTTTTVISAMVLGAALGVVFLPVFGRAIGADISRAVWGAFWGIEVIGVTFFAALMMARWLDGSSFWLAWLGDIVLWTIMALSAAVTRRLLG